MKDCKLDHGPTPSEDALDTPLRCSHCDSPIPASSALSSEGADYIRHFCGEDCLAGWCASAGHPGPNRPGGKAS